MEHYARAGSSSAAQPCSRYTVQSSDVLSDMRVNVSEEHSNKVIWYKERFLADDEIVEQLVENATSTVHWTVHRPKRGWYIRIRAPSFPPGVFIALTPLPPSSPYHTDAALTFACRTRAPPLSLSSAAPGDSNADNSKSSLDSDVTLTDSQAQRDSTHNSNNNNNNVHAHSYPPTPPANPTIQVRPPSPTAVHAKLDRLRPRPRPRPPHGGHVTHFVLTPHSTAHVPRPTETPSMFTRVVSALKTHAPSHSCSFTLSPVPPPFPFPSPTPTPAVLGHEAAYAPAAPVPAPVDVAVPGLVPVLVFHDRTPIWTARSTRGVIEFDGEVERGLGVHESFFVACALTYLEFLNERESYLAAVTD